MAYNKSNFSNANGITFGTQSSSNGNVVTASYNSTQFQSAGAYLTTAMASNKGTDFMGTNTALTANGVSMTANSSGLSFNFPAFLTTAMQSASSSVFAKTGFTTTSVAGAVVAGTMDTNGLKIAIPAYLTTAQAPGAYLTTARASNDAIGLNTALTANGVSMTANSSGLSLNFPAFLTTAQPVGAYLTTARASNDGIGLNTAQSNVTWTVNSSGISLDARGYAGTGTAMTGGSVTLNSGGISINLPAYLTTAMVSNAGSNFIGLNSAVTGASATINSSGISLNIPAAAPSPVYVQAGTTNGSLGTISFANSNGVSFGLNGSTITASAAGGGGGVAIAGNGSTTFTNGTVNFVDAGGAITIGTAANEINFSVPATSSLVGTNGISVSVNGSTISISAVNPYVSRFIYPEANLMTALSAFGNGSMSIQYIPFDGYVTATRLDALVSWSAGTSGAANTAAIAMTMFAGIYTRNGATLSSVSSATTQATYTYASNSSNYTGINSAIRAISVPMNINMSPGEYYVGFGFSTAASSVGTATTNLAQTVSMYGFGGLQSALNYAEFNAATATSNNIYSGMGIYSAALSTVPPTISLSAINQTGANISRANINLVFRNY